MITLAESLSLSLSLSLSNGMDRVWTEERCWRTWSTSTFVKLQSEFLDLHLPFTFRLLLLRLSMIVQELVLRAHGELLLLQVQKARKKVNTHKDDEFIYSPVSATTKTTVETRQLSYLK